MKFLFKYTFHLAILACVSALFSGCEQDPKYRVYDYPVPVVESIYPTDGYVTTQVVITGTNFGDRAEAVKVFFGEAQSNKVLDCKNNRLVVAICLYRFIIKRWRISVIIQYCLHHVSLQ